MKLIVNKRQYEIICAALDYFENDIRDGEELTAGDKPVELSEFVDIQDAFWKSFENDPDWQASV